MALAHQNPNPSGIDPKEKGRAPEGCGQKEINMLNVAEKMVRANPVPIEFNTHSTNRKLGIWLDKLVADAAAKGKPIAQVVQLTPDLAALLLDRNPANRRISETAVERYAYEMMGNRWVFNGEPMIISDTGELNDGQHRCAAVVKSGKTIDVILIVGVPRETRTTLDQGRARSAGDYLSMEGHRDGIHLATAANYGWQYKIYGMLADHPDKRAMKSEVRTFVAEHPALIKSLDVFTVKQGRGLGGVAFLAFCHFAISQVGRAEDVASFFIALTEGVNLGHGHLALYVRGRMMSLKGTKTQNAKAELVFKAWNEWRKGKKADKIWLSGGVLPVLER